MALSISHPAARGRCRSAASSTRRTSPAEQFATVELVIETVNETAPLSSLALTTLPLCGCEERAG